MDSRELVIGGIYKHFKGKLYQVKCIAYHSETKEKMVVYQALYGDYSVYVRPYNMFMSPVDSVKYPEVQQKYRFEQVFPDGSGMPQNVKDVKSAGAQFAKVPEPLYGKTAEAKYGKEAEQQCAKAPETGNSEEIDPRLERFLDAATYEEKLEVLAGIRDSLNDKLIDAMAVSLDVEVPEGSIDSRYVSLRNCIRAHAKYESLRLR